MTEQTLSYTFVFDPITIRRKEVPQKAVSKKPALFHTKNFVPIFTHYFYKMADISSFYENFKFCQFLTLYRGCSKIDVKFHRMQI
jgi:hypothetical protein